MQVDNKRVKEQSALEAFISKMREYAYIETFIIVTLYVGVGYFFNSDDVCMLHNEIEYALILLAVITLFHGFENGLFALGLLAIAMFYFYPTFEYVEFLVALLMTLIFSEFHYYWTKKITEAKINAEYTATKLDELSKAFYSLKISHDQLEKNYVVKPMSIRNSIEKIVNKNMIVKDDETIDEKTKHYYENFLMLLEKSFNVKSSLIVYKKDTSRDVLLGAKNSLVSYSSIAREYPLDEIFKNYLVDKSISRKQPTYVSDEKGEPTSNDDSNRFSAVLPFIIHNQVVSFLAIEKMPFMAFNRENLTSIAILLEYFSLEIHEKNTLEEKDELPLITDKKFKYEYTRLKHLYQKYKVESIVLVLRLDNELQAVRIHEKIIKMLRSLDMVTLVKENNFYYVPMMFPLHDKSAALGYLNRLLHSLEEERDKKFNYMTFEMKQTALFNKYLEENYDE